MTRTVEKPRLLTGDTPTGRLHLGHWVGSLENRVALQRDYDCYFLLANLHAFTTQVTEPKKIQQHCLDILLDYLSAGIDPQQSTIFMESDVPAIYQLASILSMLIPANRLLRNPTIKDEIRDKQLGDNMSFGFLLYPMLQVADILAFLPSVVPVGEDQIPHLEMTREVARKFNQLYCGVDPHTADADQLAAGGFLPIITAKVGRVKRLVGLGGPGKNGQLLKMSKSLGNAILLSDTPDTICQKVMNMYTDPTRLRASDPGTIENNPLWIFHDTFNPDADWVTQTKQKYQYGQIGDVACKRKLCDVLIEFIKPFQQRRKHYQDDPAQLLNILKQGAETANAVAENTLFRVKQLTYQVLNESVTDYPQPI